MSSRAVKIMGEESLYERSQPVEYFDSSLSDLIQDLKDTMAEKGGVGIAAPQIGCNQRVIYLGFEKSVRYPEAPPVPYMTLINAEYKPLGDAKKLGWEGCLSVPGMRGLVPRYSHIQYLAYDETGKKIEGELEGFAARIIQHEVDHLNGILYPFRIEDLKKFGFESVLKK